MNEAHIQAQVLLRLGQRKDVRLWRASTGAMKHTDAQGQTRFAKHGKKGQADLTGVLLLQGGAGVIGVRLEVEVKTPRGRLTKDQTQYGAMIKRLGGIWFVARSADEAEVRMDEAILKMEARL